MKKNTLILSFFILLKFIIHYFLINPIYDLHRDEYLHIDQGKHLAWGYESVPPFTSWISWLILQSGNNVFWIKFFPILFGALTIVFTWKAVEALKGNLFALITSALAITFSALLRINILYQPNSFDILSWTAVYYFLLQYFKTEKPKWLCYTAIALALGFLNKYNIAFLVMGILPAILLTAQRKIFLDKQLYIALLVAFILILPNIIWQFRNDLPVIHHMKELAATQLVNVNRADFIKEQFLFFLGAFYVIILALFALFFYAPFKPYRLFGWGFLFTLAFFMYFKAKAYYAIGLYPIMISFGSVYLESVLQKGWKVYLRPLPLLLPILLFIPVLKIGFPISKPEVIAQNKAALKKYGVLRWEDGKDHDMPQDFADMLGWSELARKIDSIYAGLPPENTLVLCDNYGQAGAINYYSKYRQIHAVSMNADYINWFPLQHEIKQVILVKDPEDQDPTRQREKSFFNSVTMAAALDNPYAREYGLKIFLLKDARVSINKILTDEIAKRKSEK